MSEKYLYAIGKRKTSSAQVRLFSGKGGDTVNGKPLSEYVSRKDLYDVVYSPLKICKLKDKFHFEVTVSGSGESAQAQAIRHALARAIAGQDDSAKAILKQAGMLTRDARKVERKKPGRHKARKSVQWSKR